MTMACPMKLHTDHSSTAFQNLLKQSRTYKEPSDLTNSEHYKPTLSQNPTEPTETHLLGGSILERSETTSSSTALGAATYPLAMNARI